MLTGLKTLLQQLISRPSVTPDDAGCLDILWAELKPLGFKQQRFACEGASTLWATHGQGAPVFVLAGHTDVVPPGDLSAWDTPPFELHQSADYLIGRGTADMKGSLSCMILAAKAFIQAYPLHPGTLAFLVTSAEEGPSMHGTPVALEALHAQGQNIDYVLVGEPTCTKRFGDMLKHGRRGSLSAELTIYGKQGHIAYPDLAVHPVHLALPALQALVTTQFDVGDASFQPTSLQISNIHAGTGAGNVIPGELKVSFNLRYSPKVTAEILQQRISALLDSHGLNYDLRWTHYGKPYLTSVTQPLIHRLSDAIESVTQLTPALSTSGGTSDARYFADYTDAVVEFGPVGETIHQTNECVKISDLEQFYQILGLLIPNLLSKK